MGRPEIGVGLTEVVVVAKHVPVISCEENKSVICQTLFFKDCPDFAHSGVYEPHVAVVSLSGDTESVQADVPTPYPGVRGRIIVDGIPRIPVSTCVRIRHVCRVILIHVDLWRIIRTVRSMKRHFEEEGSRLVVRLEKFDGCSSNVCSGVVVFIQDVSSSSVVVVFQAGCHGVYSRVSLRKPLVVVVQFFQEPVVEICPVVSVGHPFVSSGIPPKVVLANGTGEVST